MKNNSVNPPAAGARHELMPMQRITLERAGVKRKVTLMGPPWVCIGNHVKHEGLDWTVVGSAMTRGITLPGFGGDESSPVDAPALPAQPDQQ